MVCRIICTMLCTDSSFDFCLCVIWRKFFFETYFTKIRKGYKSVVKICILVFTYVLCMTNINNLQGKASRFEYRYIHYYKSVNKAIKQTTHFHLPANSEYLTYATPT